MTVINGIEIDDSKYALDETKRAIRNNDPIEDKLHVIMVISNPCQYARRFILGREFAARMEDEDDVILYRVELAYPGQKFHVTDAKNPRHLQLRAEVPLWAKENMINIGVRTLLPNDWKAFAYIDADVEFESATWAKDCLKILNGSKDVVYTHSHCADLDGNGDAMNVFSSFGYNHAKGRKYYSGSGVRYFHPGYGVAMTRKAFEKLGGLYQLSILGSADQQMEMSYLGNGIKSLNEETTEGYKRSVSVFEKNAKKLRLGYVPGVITHHFHGIKVLRGYSSRWKILVKYAYDPYKHMTKNAQGLLVPTKECPQELLGNIMKYFRSRDEDSIYKQA